MRFYEFGDEQKPVILLLPGTLCLWKSNFGHVIDKLTERFHVVCVSYDGFDPAETTEFVSVLDEIVKIEAYSKEHYGGRICASYGCSLGGSLVGLLIARRQLQIEHGILGSSDLDQRGKLLAALQIRLLISPLYRIIQRGEIRNRFLRRGIEKRIRAAGAAGEALGSLLDLKGGSLRFITKKSMENQFYSDLVTPLPAHISVPGTKVHILYALKMGEKYRARYERHFPDADMIERNLRHEELLAVYPDQWIQLIEKLCFPDSRINHNGI